MDDETKRELGRIYGKIVTLQETLNRIEARQISTTAMVSEVKEHEAPVTGSFASTDHGEK